MKTKLLGITIILMLTVGTLGVFVSSFKAPFEDEYRASVSAYYSGIERTWNAAGNADASTPNSWLPVGVPATGDNITFDGTSVTDCDWDVEENLGDFDVLSGYTGGITQTATFSCVDWYYNPANLNCFVPDMTYTITVEENASFLKTESTKSYNLIMAGDDAILTTYLGGFGRLTITGTTEIISATSILLTSGITSGGLYITDSAILNIEAGLELAVPLYWGGVYSNLGTINGEGSLTLRIYSVSMSNVLMGNIEVDLKLYQLNSGGSSRSFSIGDNLDINENSFTILSGDTTHVLTFNNGMYSVDADNMLLSTRAIFNQGTGTCTFNNYTQSGTSSIFNQDAELTIGNDFIISNGIFNAVGDMPVPGNWDTATGDYVNPDNVVTLTGASKTLAINAADSFYNVTVSGSYTMNTDTNVRLRATITGTVDGTGDFIEPLPEFTRIIVPNACPLRLYESPIEQKYWDEITLVNAPYWMYLEGNELKGIPGSNDTGIFPVSVSLTWNDMVVYQNISLVVCTDVLTDVQIFYVFLLFQIILFVIGLIGYFKLPWLLILTILGTIVIAVPTMIVFGELYMIAFILIVINMVLGAMGLALTRGKRYV